MRKSPPSRAPRAASARAASDASDLYAWLHEPHGRVFNNLTLPGTPQGRRELERITGAGLMAAAAAAGARVAIFDGRNQWYALHDGPVCRKHPALGRRDLVAEIIAAGRRRGIVYVPYLPMDCDLRAWEEHPAWRNVDYKGQPRPDSMPRCCENSPFRAYLADHLRDFAARYDIGGFWFDGFGIATDCFCPACREGFRRAHGLEAPESAAQDREAWRLWVAYKEAESARVLDEFIAAGRGVKPGLPVCVCWGAAGGRAASQKWFECYWTWPTATLQLIRGDSGAAGEFYIPAFQYAPTYPVTLPEQELRDRAMAAIANGCIPDFTLTSPPRRLKRVNAELAERAPWFAGAEPVPYAGILFSKDSQELCETDRFKDGPCFAHYGALRALLEEKIPETCLTDHALEHDDLSRHAVIVIPDAGILTPLAQERLRAFVRQGGGLVAGARTSLCAPNGVEQDDFALADLLGVHFRGRMPEQTTLPTWVTLLPDGQPAPNVVKAKLLRLGRHPIAADPLLRETKMVEVVPEFRRGRPEAFTLAYPGEMLRVTPDADTQTVVWEEFQQPGVRWPFITARRYGKGRVVYLAANLGFQYAGHYTWPYVRRLICNAARWAAGRQPPPFQVESLLQVQATLFEQADPARRVLHLLNAPNPQGYPPFTRQTWEGYFTSFGRQREDLAPVTDIAVRLRGRFSRVYLAPGRQRLPARFAGGWTSVVVPRLDTHAMVVAEE
jgi:hypothetical protein